MATKQWPVWRTMKIGTPDLRDANAFCTALKAAEYKIGSWASNMLNQPGFTVSETESEIELVKITVAELGFPNGAKRADIYNRASKQGLELCPAEVGPRLRMEYKDQPNGECLRVAMDPICSSDSFHYVWFIVHDGFGLWLDGFFGHPGSFWPADILWVFIRRKGFFWWCRRFIRQATQYTVA